MLPWALAYMASATQSAKLVERFGQRGVVSSGLVIAGAGFGIVAATSSLTSSYWLFALGLVVQALGMGLTTAPSTGAIMRSLPLHKAGVGSTVNDTTRELGGALGVAVIGSLVASHFRTSIHDTVAGLPAKATHSLAEALHTTGPRSVVRTGGTIANAAKDSYVNAFSTTLWVALSVVVVASGLVAWLLRPAATEVSDAQVAVAELEAA